MFEKLEELAKDNKKISDFHVRAGSPLAYRQTGEIIKVQDVLVKPQDLKDLLSINCNESEIDRFEKTHELDSAVMLSGLRFRANFYKTINLALYWLCHFCSISMVENTVFSRVCISYLFNITFFYWDYIFYAGYWGLS